MPIRTPAFALATLVLSACGTTDLSAPALATGSEVAFEGRLDAVDTAPWTYDGNARLVVATSTHGDVTVELPARWNLCKATGIGDAGNFGVGDRVRVAGTVTAPATVTVCERATHRIARLP